MTYEQGDLLATQGMDRARDAADENWLRAARFAVKSLIADGVPFSTDEIWAMLALFGVSTKENRALGAVIREFSRAGLIVQVGYVKTTRPEAHSRPIPLWQGAQAVRKIA